MRTAPAHVYPIASFVLFAALLPACGGGGGGGGGGSAPGGSTPSVSYGDPSISEALSPGEFVIDVGAETSGEGAPDYALEVVVPNSGLEDLSVSADGLLSGRALDDFEGSAELRISAVGENTATLDVVLERLTGEEVGGGLAASDGSAEVTVLTGIYEGTKLTADVGSFDPGTPVDLLEYPLADGAGGFLSLVLGDLPTQAPRLRLPIDDPTGAASVWYLNVYPEDGSEPYQLESDEVSGGLATFTLPVDGVQVTTSANGSGDDEGGEFGMLDGGPDPGGLDQGCLVVQVGHTGQNQPGAGGHVGSWIEYGGSIWDTFKIQEVGDIEPTGDVCIVVPGYNLGLFTGEDWLQPPVGVDGHYENDLLKWAVGHYDSVFVVGYDTGWTIDDELWINGVKGGAVGTAARLATLLKSKFIPEFDHLHPAGAHPAAQLDMVAHSMGGIVIRRMLHDHGADLVGGSFEFPGGQSAPLQDRLRALVTLASPHNGASFIPGILGPGDGADDLKKASPQMSGLNGGGNWHDSKGDAPVHVDEIPGLRVFTMGVEGDNVVGKHSAVFKSLSNHHPARRAIVDFFASGGHSSIHEEFLEPLEGLSFGSDIDYQGGAPASAPSGLSTADIVEQWLTPIQMVSVDGPWTAGEEELIQVHTSGHFGDQVKLEIRPVGGVWQALGSFPASHFGSWEDPSVEEDTDCAVVAPTGLAGQMVEVRAHDGFSVAQTGNFLIQGGGGAGGMAITQVSPTSSPNDQSLDVTIQGGGFELPLQVELVGAGSSLTANPLWIYGSTQLVAIFDLVGAAPGPYSVKVANTQTGSAVILADAFEVIDAFPAPVVEGVSPSAGYSNVASQEVSIWGSGFTAGASVRLSGPTSFEATEVFVQAPNSLIAKLPLAGKPTGPYSVSVTNPDGKGSPPLAGAFEIEAPPVLVLTGITPTSGQNDGNYQVEVSGSSIDDDAQLKLAGPQELSALWESVNSSGTLLTATLPLYNLTPGTYDVIVLNEDDTAATLPDAFTVTQASVPPQVTQVAPSGGDTADTALAVEVIGQHFEPGASFWLSGPANIYPTGVAFAGSGKLTGTLNLSGKSLGCYTVTVQNPSGLTGSKSCAFTVSNPPQVEVNSISPSSAYNDVNQSKSLTVQGKSFQSGAQLKLVKSSNPNQGNTLTCSGESVSVSTQLTAYYNFNGALVGHYDVVVTNPNGTAGTLGAGFEVKQPAPTYATLSIKSGTSKGSSLVTNLGFGNVPACTGLHKIGVYVHNDSGSKTMDNWFAKSNASWLDASPKQGVNTPPNGWKYTDIVVDANALHQSISASQYGQTQTATITFTANDLASGQPANGSPWQITVTATPQAGSQNPILDLTDKTGNKIANQTINLGVITGTSYYDFKIWNINLCSASMTWDATDNEHTQTSIKYKNHTQHGAGSGVGGGGAASNKVYVSCVPGAGAQEAKITVTPTNGGGSQSFYLTWTAGC